MDESFDQRVVASDSIQPGTTKPQHNYPFYTPLEVSRREIRLIQIDPHSTKNLICTISIVSLDSKPQYAALSYVWGDPVAAVPITINGNLFQATEALANALVRVRDEYSQDPEFFLWVDGICINQEDGTERTHQVQLMRDIYFGGLFVISWLACKDGRVGQGFSWIAVIADAILRSCLKSAAVEFFDSPPYKSLNEIILALNDGGETLDLTQWLNDFPELCQGDQELVKPTAAWDTIKAVMEHEYWTRLWIFQELLLSRESVFLSSGPPIAMYMFSLVMDWIHFVTRRNRPLPDFFPRPLTVWMNVNIGKQPSFSLCRRLSLYRNAVAQYGTMEAGAEREIKFRILLDTSSMRATNPLDHVYGFLGVLNAAAEIVPDYSHSVGFVYRQWTRWLAFTTGDLRIIAEAGIGASRSGAYGLPSWTPDWNSSWSTWQWELDFGKGANVGLEHLSGRHFEFSEDLNALYATGIKVEKLRTVECLPKSIDLLLSKPSIFLETYMRLRSGVHPTGDPPLQVFCRTIARNIGFDDLKHRKYSESILKLAHDIATVTLDLENANILRQLELHPETGPVELISRDFLRPSDLAQTNSFIAVEPLSPGDAYNTWVTVIVLGGHQLFWTESGYLGLTNLEAKPGDFVCVFAECSRPVIMRKMESHYTLIGSCFMHGLMDGEVAQVIEEGQAMMERFKIL